MAESTIRLKVVTTAEQTLETLQEIRSQIATLSASLGSVTGASAAATAGLSAATAAAAATGTALAGVAAGAAAATAGEAAATAAAVGLTDALADSAAAEDQVDGDGLEELAASAEQAQARLRGVAAGLGQIGALRGQIEAIAASIAAAAAKGGKWVAERGMQSVRRIAIAAGKGVRDLGRDLAAAALKGGSWLASKGLALLKASALAAVAALTAGAVAVATFGAKQEQTRLKLEVMLGSVEKANALLGQMQQFANVTPFNTGEVVSAGQTLLGFGVAAGDVLTRLKMLGDISAGTGKDLNELAAIYGKVMAKGKAETEQLNQLTEAGVPIIRALADMYGVSEAAVYDMAAKGKISAADLQKALESLTATGGVFGGMMERQSQTVGGLWSTLIGNLQTIAGTIGEQLAPIMKMVLQYLVGWSDQINAMAKDGTLLEWFGKIAQVGVTTFAEFAKWTATCVNYGIAGVKTLQGWTDMLWGGLRAGFWSLVAFVTDGITAIVNGILKAYNWVVTKFGGKEVGLMKTDTEGMWDKAGQAYNDTGEAAGRAFDGRFFDEAMKNNRAFDQAADEFAKKINGAIQKGVDDGKKKAEKQNEDEANTKLDKGKPTAAETASGSAARKKAPVDALTKIGGYNFGLNSVSSIDKERNVLLSSILDVVKRMDMGTGGALA